MEKRISILLVEDNRVDQMAFERFVERQNLPYNYEIAGSVSEARKALAATQFDVTLVDYLLGDGTAFDLFDEIKSAPIVVITGSGDEDIAVKAMKAGANDYLIKDPQGDYLITLPVIVENAISRKHAEKELKRYQTHLEELVKERTAEVTAAYERLFAEMTERRRAEEALRRSENMLSSIIDQSPFSTWTSDANGTLIRQNAASRKLFGIESDEQTVGKYNLFSDPLIREQGHLDKVKQVFKQGRAVHFDIDYDITRVHTIDVPQGTHTLLSVTIFPVKDLEGNVVNAVAQHRDITERVRAERLLRALDVAALAMQRALTHKEIFTAVAKELAKLGLSCIILLMDESQSKLLAKYLSYEPKALQAAEKLVGLKHEECPIPIATVDICRKVVWEKQSVFVQSTQDVLRQALPVLAKRFAGQIAKTLRLGKFIAAPLIVEDEVIGVLSVQSEDLTAEDMPTITAFAHQVAAAWRKASLLQDLERGLQELKQTQDQLIQAQKMEAVGRLAGGVAHDFNNILTAITGYADFLLMSLDQDDPQRQDVQEIKKAADRATMLTHQLLAFSRKQVLQPQMLDLNATVANIEDMLRRLIGEDIDLVTSFEPKLAQVMVDPGQIEQVIMNLAINARDAMPTGGQLTIETANVMLDTAYARAHPGIEPGAYVRLAVSDSGMGMTEEIRSHLFEPFFTTKEKGKGTGLGLATVYGIVEQSGGHIEVYSEPGLGATFKIYLPQVCGTTETAEPEQSPKALPKGTETILLVEDEKIVRELTRRVLERCGYTVLEAHRPAEALLLSDRHAGPIHLAVADVVMPEMGGRELVERLASSRPEMKVLYISGYTDDAIARYGVLASEEAFLEKPFTPAALARKVREVLDVLRMEE